MISHLETEYYCEYFCLKIKFEREVNFIIKSFLSLDRLKVD